MNERYIAADAPILDPELAGIGSLRQSVRLTMRRFADNFDRTRIAGRNVRWMAGAAPCALLRNSFGGTKSAPPTARIFLRWTIIATSSSPKPRESGFA
jgi:hypothetical protein